MRKKKEIILNTDSDFRYGSCVSRALIKAFDTNDCIIRALSFSIGVKDPGEGFTYFDCKRLIHLLCKGYRRRVRYCPNYGGITYAQMAFTLDKYQYLVLFDIHLSYVQKGQIFDGYFDKQEIMKIKPTGWFEIQ